MNSTNRNRIPGGITAIDLTTFVTGGFATLLLANQGKEVIEIEHPLNFENASSGFESAPPLPGADTEAVLRAAGYADEENALREEGAIPSE